MDKLLSGDIVQQIEDLFTGLDKPVQLIYFGSQDNCEYCDETLQLIEEVCAISVLVSIAIYDLDTDASLANIYNVNKAPGLVIAAKEGDQITDFGIRLAGIPSGHEFSSLIQDIVLVSNRDSGLNSHTREFLKNLDKPIKLQVFVTPT